nr:MAG TPA: hypothetical protein [Caudoviricetes sp.]
MYGGYFFAKKSKKLSKAIVILYRVRYNKNVVKE